MKTAIVLWLCALSFSQLANGQGLYALPTDYDSNFADICDKATSQWSMEYDMTVKNIEDIYNALNFSSYRIDVVPCESIKSSALAYLNPYDGNRYILINKNKLTGLDQHYYSHLFVVAHEFAHHALNHFGSSQLTGNEKRRQLELEADTYAASLVKKLGGVRGDCLYALDRMSHPSVDDYSTHPTKAKRIAAVNEGFELDLEDDESEETHSSYTDLLPEYSNMSLLKYQSGLNKYDINHYYSETKLLPASIIYDGSNYWVYWRKNESVKSYSVYWNYDNYPEADVKDLLEDGYNVEFADRINNKWYLVLWKYDTRYAQKVVRLGKSLFRSSSDFYNSVIRGWFKEGYAIQNLISYDTDNYLVIFNKLSGIVASSWAIRGNFEDFEQWYQSQTHDYMYCHKIVDGNHFGFMLDSEEIDTWEIRLFDGNNIQDIVSKLEEGFFVDNIVGDDDGMRFTLRKDYD